MLSTAHIKNLHNPNKNKEGTSFERNQPLLTAYDFFDKQGVKLSYIQMKTSSNKSNQTIHMNTSQERTMPNSSGYNSSMYKCNKLLKPFKHYVTYYN